MHENSRKIIILSNDGPKESQAISWDSLDGP